MRRDSFTERFGITYRALDQVLDMVPEQVRLGLHTILVNLATDGNVYLHDLYGSLFQIPSIHRSYIKYPPMKMSGDVVRRHLENLLQSCAWNIFFDIAQVSAEHVSEVSPELVSDFEYTFNELLLENGIQWVLKDGKIERRRPEPIATVIEESFQFLAQQGFEASRSQLQKAVRALDQRPEPDVENCVKDAVGALEGTARTLSTNPKASLKSILDAEPFSSRTHAALREALLKIEGYRNDAPGAGHSMVAGKPKVETADAEFVLTSCVAGIIFLMSKGKSP